MLRGVGAAVEHEPLLKTLAASGIRTVLDVGANVGQFTLVARRLFPEARIIAFEPLPAACAQFQDIHGSDLQVRLVPAALGPECATVSMHVSTARDSSSLLPITATQTRLFPGTHESHRENVAVLPLLQAVEGAELSRSVLLKIDVQGFELQVLQGCEPALASIDFVYVECSFVELYLGQALVGEVVAWLGDREFHLAGIGGFTPGASGVGVQADLLFRRVTTSLGGMT
jgi:FkbM family methyltransferase